MEDKLKERLTGAAILVAILVLVVPELFRGTAPAPAAAPPNTPTPDNAAPLNTYRIDLQPVASAPAPTAAAADAPATATPESSAPAGAVPAAVATTTAEPLATPSATTAIAGRAAAANVAANESTATKPAASKTVAAKPAATPRVAAASTTSAASTARGWIVRLGVFSKRDNAQKLRQQLQDKGVTVAVTGPDGRGLYSVHSVRLADRNAATDWQKHAKGLGFAGVLTEAP